MASPGNPTPQTTPTPEAETRALAEDRSARRTAFWSVLLLIALIVGAGHLIEHLRSYQLTETPGIEQGSYGIALTRVPPKEPGTFRVLLLGNSVYQRSNVCPNFRDFARAEGRPIEFINLAQIGSNISDYQFQLAWALAQNPERENKPDAVLVSLGSFTFSNLGFEFNSSSDEIAYDPRVVRVVPSEAYERHFTTTEEANHIIDLIAPLRRSDTILQHDLYQGAEAALASAGADVSWFTDTLPLPRLNLMGNQFDLERRRGRFHPGMAWLNRPFKDDAPQTFSEVLSMIEKTGAGIFILRQPCKHFPISEDATELIANELATPRAVPIDYVDLEREWNRDSFMDTIHPREENQTAYAREHYDLFIRFLERSGYADRIAPSGASSTQSQPEEHD